MINYTGYRSEEPYGSGVRDMLRIVCHEIFELGNDDIMITLKKNTNKTLLYLRKLYKQGFTHALWLCDTKRQVIYGYQAPKETVNKHIIKNGIIISDLGSDGKLIAFKPDRIIK
jgi:hypothetical protein